MIVGAAALGAYCTVRFCGDYAAGVRGRVVSMLIAFRNNMCHYFQVSHFMSFRNSVMFVHLSSKSNINIRILSNTIDTVTGGKIVKRKELLVKRSRGKMIL